MKQLILLIGIVLILTGCAHTPIKIQSSLISPSDAVLFYMNSLANNNPENTYYVASSTTKENISYVDLEKSMENFKLLQGKDLLKNVILAIDEYSSTDNFVYLLIVLKPKFKNEIESTVYKFHTHFENNEWKLHINYESPGKIELTPTYLNLNKKEVTLADINLIKNLIKNDQQKNNTAKLLPNQIPRSSQLPSPAKPNESSVSIDPKLQIIQKCYTQGKQLYDEGNYSEAIKQFQKVVAIDEKAFNAKDYIEKCKQQLQ